MSLDFISSNVLVTGNLSAVGGNLGVIGNVYCTGDVIGFGQLSDQRLKENVRPLSNCLAAINGLNPVRFNWNDEEFNKFRRGREDIGLIAQETLAEVKGEFNGYQTVNYDKLVPFLIGAVQELSQAWNSAHVSRQAAE
jgi:hypothetical protein